MAVSILGPKKEVNLILKMLDNSNEEACTYIVNNNELRVEGENGLDFLIKTKVKKTKNRFKEQHHERMVFVQDEKYIFDRVPDGVTKEWFYEHGFYKA